MEYNRLRVLADLSEEIGVSVDTLRGWPVVRVEKLLTVHKAITDYRRAADATKPAVDASEDLPPPPQR